jgi:hypothetical protein
MDVADKFKRHMEAKTAALRARSFRGSGNRDSAVAPGKEPSGAPHILQRGLFRTLAGLYPRREDRGASTGGSDHELEESEAGSLASEPHGDDDGSSMRLDPSPPRSVATTTDDDSVVGPATAHAAVRGGGGGHTTASSRSLLSSVPEGVAVDDGPSLRRVLSGGQLGTTARPWAPGGAAAAVSSGAGRAIDAAALTGPPRASNDTSRTEDGGGGLEARAGGARADAGGGRDGSAGGGLEPQGDSAHTPSSVGSGKTKSIDAFITEQVWCRCLPCRAVPCRAVPCRAVPCRAVPCRAVPCRVPPVW